MIDILCVRSVINTDLELKTDHQTKKKNEIRFTFAAALVLSKVQDVSLQKSPRIEVGGEKNQLSEVSQGIISSYQQQLQLSQQLVENNPIRCRTKQQP